MKLGVCYYPEHWSPEKWASDAAEMRELGLSDVRIGEFAWSRSEPEPGRLEWGWLDEAIAILSQEGLKIILGTPTVTPPKWLVDLHPETLAIDAMGHPRAVWLTAALLFF
ncbi:MAG TPA: beta-galactosidase [Coleofasciculaceae cyanobacterium]|jgi:beta-galactosidase